MRGASLVAFASVILAGCVEDSDPMRAEDDGVVLEVLKMYSPGDLLVQLSNERSTPVTAAQHAFRLRSGGGDEGDPTGSDRGRPFPLAHQLDPGDRADGYLEFRWNNDPPYVLVYAINDVTIELFLDWPALESVTYSPGPPSYGP